MDNKQIYDSLTLNDVANIFNTFLKCPDCDGCENCTLNNQKIGCFKLRDMAMQKVIDMVTSKGIM